jgi:hypothetical protein
MKIDIVLVDYFKYGELRTKEIGGVAKLNCGRKPLIDSIINNYNVYNSVSIIITGGYLNDYESCYILKNNIKLYENVCNDHLDFSGYLFGIEQFLNKTNNGWFVLINSSATVSDLELIIQNLYRIKNKNILVGTGFSSFTRSAKFSFISPHLQSYILAFHNINIKFISKFMLMNAQKNMKSKRDIIYNYEISLSRIFMEEKEGILYINKAKKIKIIKSYFCIYPISIDSRISMLEYAINKIIKYLSCK